MVSAIKEFSAESIAQLTAVTGEIFTDTNSRWWFRGQEDYTWDLLPRVWRGYTAQKERYMTNLFYNRARTRYTKCPDDVDYGAWLALMQHYGLPTRLLDWTTSPLVAAYFVTKYHFDSGQNIHDQQRSDAAIWVIEPHRLNSSQGYEPVFLPLNANKVQPLVTPAFKKYKDSNTTKVLATVPLEDDLRMLVQQGVFTIHTTNEPLNELSGCDEWLKKIIIPAKAIPDIAWEFDLLNFRLADLFPDLQNLSKEITNMHKPS